MVGAGDVFYAALDPVRGTEQRGTRPVVIVSVVSLGPRAVVVPVTTKRRDWPTRVRVSVHGIDGDAMCEQVRAIDTARLGEDRYGRISPQALREIQQTIARLIGIY
ncbi:MAG: type II toxin-antitoxin system PemK/MazF family toxin [Actinomycetia bacterium]|nr:type II toxin-antitoxin system PemK/MazF family toxin [Actinomycetes bacterium]